MTIHATGIPPAPTVTIPASNGRKYAALVARNTGDFAHQTSLVRLCARGIVPTKPCLADAAAQASSVRRLLGALTSADKSGSADFIGPPPDEVATLVTDTRVDGNRLLAAARTTASKRDRTDYVAQSDDAHFVLNDLKAWKTYA